MRQVLFLLFPFLMTIIMTGCNKEEEANVPYVFELKFGETKQFSINGNDFRISLTDISDNVWVNCELADFIDGIPDDLRTYVTLSVNDKSIQVASRLCGAIYYKNDGNDMQQIIDYLSECQDDNDYIYYFSNGTVIPNSPFCIYMAKSDPILYLSEGIDISKENYKFMFIIK